MKGSDIMISGPRTLSHSSPVVRLESSLIHYRCDEQKLFDRLHAKLSVLFGIVLLQLLCQPPILVFL